MFLWKVTLMPAPTPFGYFDLMDEMTKSGCPICNLLVRDTQKLLNTILYEYVTEPEMHHMLRTSRGLCNVHGHQLAELGNALSIATLYHAILDEILKELDRSTSNSKPQQRSVRRIFGRADNTAVVQALDPKQNCHVCEKNTEYEKRFVNVFTDYLSDDKLLSAYHQSDGLCLAHFKQVLSQSSNQEDSQNLINIQREIWMQLKHETSEFMRKYDFNNADELMSIEESDSWLRVIRQVSGEKGVFGLS